MSSGSCDGADEFCTAHGECLGTIRYTVRYKLFLIYWYIGKTLSFMLIGFHTKFCVIFLSGCVNNNGEAGDGTTKGTCSGTDEVCTALGECLGT